MINETILVTGGTGFVGSFLLRKLKGKVRCFSRRSSDVGEIKDFDIAYGDLRSKNDVDSAVRGVSYVVHLSGATPKDSYRTIYDVNVTGTKNIVHASISHNIKKFIHISTLNVLYQKKGEYGKTKEEAERIVINSGLDYVILRPTLIYGRDDRDSGIYRIVRFIKKYPFFPIIGNGKSRTQPVYVEDVVDAIINAIKLNVSKKAYNIAGPVSLSFNEIIDLIIQELNVKRIKVHLPLPVMLAITAAYERISRLPKIRTENLWSINQDMCVNIEETMRDLKFRPRGFEQGLKLLV
jgi:nucleoside-diphosphate-sugar epimerase